MTEFLSKLFSGFSRSIAIWASSWLAKAGIISEGADVTQVESAIGVVVCGLLWAGIHWIEDKIKAKTKPKA